jgi:hypothetical protein
VRLVSHQETRLRGLKSSYNFSASMGTLLEWSAVFNQQQRKWRRGHITLSRYSFRISSFEKTWEYRRNLQLEDAARQSALLVFWSIHRFGRSSQVDRKFLEREIPNFCI